MKSGDFQALMNRIEESCELLLALTCHQKKVFLKDVVCRSFWEYIFSLQDWVYKSRL